MKLSASGPGGTAPWNASWAAQRWIRVLEAAAEGQRLIEGLEYARNGQTRSFSVDAACVNAAVQGREYRAYSVRLKFVPFTDEQWARVIQSMSDQAVYAAKLIAGELPASIDDIFMPLGLKLFPTEASEVTASCTCREADAAAGTIWCKHAACTAYLFGEKLANDAFLMFKARGLDGSELLDRLRHARASASPGRSSGVIYAGRVPGVSDLPSDELEGCLDRFWDCGPQLDGLDLRVAPPQVTHPLLRRLGPSPFVGAAFPLVGLLASCYEVVSEHTVREAREEAGSPEVGPLT
jgi:uncharacterized Zn finger protein